MKGLPQATKPSCSIGRSAWLLGWCFHKKSMQVRPSQALNVWVHDHFCHLLLNHCIDMVVKNQLNNDSYLSILQRNTNTHWYTRAHTHTHTLAITDSWLQHKKAHTHSGDQHACHTFFGSSVSKTANTNTQSHHTQMSAYLSVCRQCVCAGFFHLRPTKKKQCVC